MGYSRKMPENMESLQIVGKKFYKAEEGAALFSVGVHTFEKMGKEANVWDSVGMISILRRDISG